MTIPTSTRVPFLLLAAASFLSAADPEDLQQLKRFAFDPRGVAIRAPSGTVTASCIDSKTLEVSAGDYQTSFSALTSWTLRAVTYRGQVIDQAGAGTYLQTVINEKLEAKEEAGKKADPFIGSGHRPEQIDSIAIAYYAGPTFISDEVLWPKPGKGQMEVDKHGRPSALLSTYKGGAGTTLILKKKSRLVSAANGHLASVECSTVISTAGIEQYVRVTAGTGNLSAIAFMYPLMHMLPMEAESYFAYRGNQVVETAAFKADGSMSLSRPITALVTCVPGTGTGIALFHTVDHPDGKVLLWNRGNDHKLYFRYPFPRKSGDVLDYTLFFKGFPCHAIAGTAPADALGWKSLELPSGTATAAPFIQE